jgi:hypothetical protein
VSTPRGEPQCTEDTIDQTSLVLDDDIPLAVSCDAVAALAVRYGGFTVTVL